MPSSVSAHPSATVALFSDEDIAFALAWEVYAPGLGGWTVQRDVEEDGTDLVFVDPPLVYGDGFAIRPERDGVRIVSPLGMHRAATLRDALLLICPLGAQALEQADRLARMPSPTL